MSFTIANEIRLVGKTQNLIPGMFSETDLSLIRMWGVDANRLDVAVRLCLLRIPGQCVLPDAAVPMPLMQWIGRQGGHSLHCWFVRPRLPPPRTAGCSCSHATLYCEPANGKLSKGELQDHLKSTREDESGMLVCV